VLVLLMNCRGWWMDGDVDTATVLIVSPALSCLHSRCYATRVQSNSVNKHLGLYGSGHHRGNHVTPSERNVEGDQAGESSLQHHQTRWY
jgi:hypothetical protein